jgi:glutathione peroxidase
LAGVVVNYITKICAVNPAGSHSVDFGRADCRHVVALTYAGFRTTVEVETMKTPLRGARLFVIVALLACGGAFAACQAPLLDVEFRPLADKQPVNLCQQYQGQVLLVVNTASKCGFTPQYEGLEALHARLKDRGFAVLGFPSNDFRAQEPGTEKEIREFCTNTYGVQFPMFEKVTVTQESAVPFYRALAAGADGEYPGWNFHKYLIGRDGKVVGSFGSRITPEDASLLEAIEAELNKPQPAG